MSTPAFSTDCLHLIGRLVDQLAIGNNTDTSSDLPVKRGLISTVSKFLSAFDGLSVPDSETGMVDSIRFYLRTEATRFPSSISLQFDEHYHQFCAVNSDGVFRTRVLVLLLALSRQRTKSKQTKIKFPSKPLSSTIQTAQVLPILTLCVFPVWLLSPWTDCEWDTERLFCLHQQKLKCRKNGCLDLPGLVQERLLVHDVLYICQGIDGKHIKLNPNASPSSFVLLDPKISISFPQQSLVFTLCELGFLFKKIQSFALTKSSLPELSASGQMDVDSHTFTSTTSFTSQAFSYAISKELSEYYRLMAVLESQSTKPGNFLTLRRLYVWLTEALRKMRTLAILVDSTHHLKGGALASAIFAHSQTGDPTNQQFIMKLLRRVSVPLFTMIRTWVFEGEFSDPHHEFFIVDNAGLKSSSHSLTDHGKAFDLWRAGYTINHSMLPGFVSPTLAQKILRAGKSINFLRSRCGDVDWVQEQASRASSGNDVVSYTNLETLQSLVEEASSRVDDRLMQAITKKFYLPQHFEALRRYILLGQGDFVQSLLDCLRPELDKEMSKISEVVVMGCIRAAIHSSNAAYDDEDVLERLCMKKLETLTSQTGWEVFALDYRIDPLSPLSTVITPHNMRGYQKVFRLLWKLKRAESRLNESWRGMKCINRNTSRPDLHVGKRLRCLFLLAFNARTKLVHFCTNFQHYVMFEVLEGAWKNFTSEADQATDLDELIKAHEQYVESIIHKCLLGADATSEALKNMLSEYFHLIDGFCNTIARLLMDAEQILNFLYSRANASQGNWAAQGSRVEMDDVPNEYYHEMKDLFASVLEKYDLFLSSFTERVTGEAQIDLRFLMFRLDFEETCQAAKIDAEAFITQEEDASEDMQE